MQKYLERLRNLEELDDPEKIHGEADDILCELLRELGYAEVVECYNSLPRWYA